MADDKKIDIKLGTSFDPTGTNQAQSALRGVDVAAKGTGKLGEATEKTNVELRDLAKFGSAGTQIISSLQRASLGGTDAIFGLSGAIRGVIGIVTAGTGPIGVAVAALGLLGGAFLALRKPAGDAKKDLEDSAKAAEELGKIRLDTFKRELDSITTAYALLEKRGQAVLAQIKEIADAEARARAATRENDPGLTAKDKAIKNTLEERDARLAGITGKATGAREKADSDAAELDAIRKREATERDALTAANVAQIKAEEDEKELQRLKAIRSRQNSDIPFTAPGGEVILPQRLTPQERQKLQELESNSKARAGTDANAAEAGARVNEAREAREKAEATAAQSAAIAADAEAAAVKLLAAAQIEFAEKLKTIELGPLKQAMEKAAERTQEWERQMAIDIAEAERMRSLRETNAKIFIDGKEFTPPVIPNTVPRNPPPQTPIVTPQERKIRDLERQNQRNPQASTLDPAIAALLARVATTLDRFERL